MSGQFDIKFVEERFSMDDREQTHHIEAAILLRCWHMQGTTIVSNQTFGRWRTKQLEMVRTTLTVGAINL